MKLLGVLIRGAGFCLGLAGGLFLGAVMLVTVASGGWPDYLASIAQGFHDLHEFTGPWQFPALIAVFVGPGALLYWLGDSLVVASGRRKDLQSRKQSL